MIGLVGYVKNPSGYQNMKNRIIVFSPSSVEMNENSGGVSNSVLRISREYTYKGFDVSIICLQRELTRKLKSAKIVIDKDITRYACSSIFEVVKVYIRISRRSAVYMFHIHGYFNSYTIVLPILAKVFRQKVLLSMHGKFASGFLEQQHKKKNVYNFLITKQLKRFIDVASAMSVDEMNNLISIGFKKVKIVQNGIERVEEKVEPKSSRDFQILFLGCIEPRKQPLFIIEIIEELRRREVPVNLVIAGSDDFGHKIEVEQRINSLGLTDLVTILDFIEGKQKQMLISKSMLTILPSKAEGHPLVLCESISNGTPCLYSANSNFEQINTFCCGIEVEGFVVSEWADKALEILTSERYYDKENYVSLSESVTWSAAADKYLKSVL